MLWLDRRLDESIIIGDSIVITVVGFRDNKVRLGIDAPKDVPIHREEVHIRIHAEKGGAI